MTKSIEIQKLATALNREIKQLQGQVDAKTDLLEALGNVCDHPTVETYRGHRQVGRCEFCLKKFMSREDVDQIFSE